MSNWTGGITRMDTIDPTIEAWVGKKEVRICIITLLLFRQHHEVVVDNNGVVT
jgi:hypothetical protein